MNGISTDMDEATARIVDTEIAKLIIEASRLNTKAAKLRAGTSNINLKLRWMPFVWTSGLMAVLIAVAKYFATN
jgi:hypothetical protein